MSVPGGWTNIIEKYTKANATATHLSRCAGRARARFKFQSRAKWIGERLNGHQQRSVTITCTSSGTLDLPPASLDAVFTDPPDFGNVQYGELMDFCYVWLRRLVGHDATGFEREIIP